MGFGKDTNGYWRKEWIAVWKTHLHRFGNELDEDVPDRGGVCSMSVVLAQRVSDRLRTADVHWEAEQRAQFCLQHV